MDILHSLSSCESIFLLLLLNAPSKFEMIFETLPLGILLSISLFNFCMVFSQFPNAHACHLSVCNERSIYENNSVFPVTALTSRIESLVYD